MIDELRASNLLDDDAYARFCRRGHVVYESGDHGDTWLALDLLFANPRRLQRAAARLAERLRRHEANVVCGPLVGGALVGQWVAHALNATFMVATPRPGTATSGPGYAIARELGPALSGQRVVVVDDVINMGAATLACVQEIEAWGGRVVAVASLLARTPGAVDQWHDRQFAVEFLAGVSWNVWPAHDCPLCRAGAPIEAPA